MPYAERNVHGDGNCFFRALLLSAQARGLLKQVLEGFHVSTTESCRHDGMLVDLSEAMMRLIQCVRNSLASHLKVRGAFVTGLRTTYDLLVDLIKEEKAAGNPNLIREIARDSDLSDWVADYFAETPSDLYDVDDFIAACGLNIRKSGSFVGGYETLLVSEVLGKLSLFLVISKEDTFPEQPEVRTLYLRNVPGHYHYIDYPAEFQEDRVQLAHAEQEARNREEEFTRRFGRISMAASSSSSPSPSASLSAFQSRVPQSVTRNNAAYARSLQAQMQMQQSSTTRNNSSVAMRMHQAMRLQQARRLDDHAQAERDTQAFFAEERERERQRGARALVSGGSPVRKPRATTRAGAGAGSGGPAKVKATPLKAKGKGKGKGKGEIKETGKGKGKGKGKVTSVKAKQ